jgi:hypothetical protein
MRHEARRGWITRRGRIWPRGCIGRAVEVARSVAGGAEDDGGGLAGFFGDGVVGEAAEEGVCRGDAGLGEEELGALVGEAAEGREFFARGGCRGEGEEAVDGEVVDAGEHAGAVGGAEELAEESLGLGGAVRRRDLPALGGTIGEGVRRALEDAVHGSPF